MKGVRRSSLIGGFIADVIRALDLKELTNSNIRPGEWFIHSGVTSYSDRYRDPRTATIKLPGGKKIVSYVRRDCEITATASTNMNGEDDISLVVGRLLSETKFDLIAAGYRQPPFLAVTNPTQTISLDVDPDENVLESITPRQWRNPVIQYEGWSDEETLLATVVDTFDRFKHAVEHQGAWKQLYNPGLKPAHESRHQALFRLFANIAFDALGIIVQPGADHGSGPTDLTLTLRNAIHVIEFKKDHDLQKIKHGLTVQLPTYMMSAGTQSGSYLVMCHDRDPGDVMELISKSKQQIGMDCTLFTDAVDCRPQKSASKA